MQSNLNSDKLEKLVHSAVQLTNDSQFEDMVIAVNDVYNYLTDNGYEPSKDVIFSYAKITLGDTEKAFNLIVKEYKINLAISAPQVFNPQYQSNGYRSSIYDDETISMARQADYVPAAITAMKENFELICIDETEHNGYNHHVYFFTRGSLSMHIYHNVDNGDITRFKVHLNEHDIIHYTGTDRRSIRNMIKALENLK